MKLLMVVSIASALVVLSAVAEENNVGRFQVAGPPPIVVIDSATGQLWVITGEAPNYFMRPVCYRGPDGRLMLTPVDSRSLSEPVLREEPCT